MSVLAVPRSIDRSRENSHRMFLNIYCFYLLRLEVLQMWVEEDFNFRKYSGKRAESLEKNRVTLATAPILGKVRLW